MGWYIEVLKNYADFSGRSRRKEYWMFVLMNFVVSIILYMGLGITGFLFGMKENVFMTIIGLYDIAMFLPIMSVGVRRMHDTDHSGWWIIVPIANFILAISAGDHGDNSYGPDPKGDDAPRNLFSRVQSPGRMT